jgi:3-hydroxy acid dehydrogenase/malonic semialdehyde reductase
MQDSFTLITGASSGFGQAIARTLAAEGHSLIITARRKERLQRLAEELSGQAGVEVIPLCFDVRRRDEVEAAAKELKGRVIQLNHLINNAGVTKGLSGKYSLAT